jgi:hypothetical protein
LTTAGPSTNAASPMILGWPLVPSIPMRSKVSPIPWSGSKSSVTRAVVELFRLCHTSAMPKPSIV